MLFSAQISEAVIERQLKTLFITSKFGLVQNAKTAAVCLVDYYPYRLLAKRLNILVNVGTLSKNFPVCVCACVRACVCVCYDMVVYSYSSSTENDEQQKFDHTKLSSCLC